jgi:preprotein translocase subunit SecF
MNIISHRKIFLTISSMLVIASIILVLTFGLKQGIDLTGGTEWVIQPEAGVTRGDIEATFADTYPDLPVTVDEQEAGTFTIRLPDTSEELHRDYLTTLKIERGEIIETSFISIGPSIGRELRTQAIRAMIGVLLAISLYVAWAFRKVSEEINTWKYGLTTLITLFHDVALPTGFLALLGWWKGVEIDTNFIVALLVIMGFSVHDTIVVFDRIRENIMRYKGKKPLNEIINISIRETLARSINTSLTLIFVLATLLIWGPTSIFYFILVILIGTIAGTYSSICIASPILYIWGRKKKR